MALLCGPVAPGRGCRVMTPLPRRSSRPVGSPSRHLPRVLPVVRLPADAGDAPPAPASAGSTTCAYPPNPTTGSQHVDGT